jgi:hypothetical protein
MQHSVGDHWPIAKRHGGTKTVPCCTTCHTFKDRLSLEKWPVEWFELLTSEWESLSTQMKLFIGKLYDCAIDILNDDVNDNAIEAFRKGAKIRSIEWPEDWSIRRVAMEDAFAIEFDAPEDIQEQFADDKCLDNLIVKALLNDAMVKVDEQK